MSPVTRDGRVEGKVIIVTGAAGGIGAASARALSAEGAKLMLTDADGEAASGLADSIGEGAIGLQHDVTDEAAWNEVVGTAVGEHGRIDGLINNAGIFLAAPLLETTPDQYRKVIEVNQFGVFLGMRAVAPAMGENGGGSIVNVSSVAGLVGSPYLTAYSASKFAVRGMSKVAAKELARAGIRVNSVHPGQVDTEMNAKQAEETPELLERLIKGIPLRRIATPEEIAAGIVYLSSDESGFTTGSELVIDGGTSA